MYEEEEQQDTSQQLQRLVQAYIKQQRQKQKGGIAQGTINNKQQDSSIMKQLFGYIFYECIGMIKALWKNKQTKQLEYMDYGTAFLVAPQIIMTCAHNIYNQDEKTVADQIIFVPNHHGYIEPNTEKHYSIKKNFYQFISLKEEQTLREVPSINQLCLIALSQRIEYKSYIPIGNFKPQPNQYVEIIGYPSKGYAKINNLLSVNLNRSHLKGRIVSIEDITINHKLLTKVGHSGSPILYKAANNKIAAIGIHTHRGNAHENRGLYFNEKVIKIIKKFEIQLIISFYFIDGIKYVQNKQIQLDEQFQKIYQKAKDLQQALNLYFNGSNQHFSKMSFINNTENSILFQCSTAGNVNKLPHFEYILIDENQKQVKVKT